MEGKHIMVGASEVLCPPVQEILLLYHSSDYHYADDFVPPPCSLNHTELTYLQQLLFCLLFEP